MSAPAEARAELVAALQAADLHVLDHVPNQIEPPVVLIEPSENYLSRGETFKRGEWAITCDVYALVPLGQDNDHTTDQLDDMLAALLHALAGVWGIDAMSKPGPLTAGEWLAYGVALTVSTYIEI